MLLIGIRNITTSTGNTEDSLGHVTHQRVEIIAGSPTDTKETLSELYHSMVKKGNESKKELGKLQDELEFSDMSEDEFEKLESKLLSDIQILKYERVIITEGLILK
jgi:polyhydroxyalkanoate synthesis regulator phasin